MSGLSGFSSRFVNSSACLSHDHATQYTFVLQVRMRLWLMCMFIFPLYFLPYQSLLLPLFSLINLFSLFFSLFTTVSHTVARDHVALAQAMAVCRQRSVGRTGEEYSVECYVELLPRISPKILCRTFCRIKHIRNRVAAALSCVLLDHSCTFLILLFSSSFS